MLSTLLALTLAGSPVVSSVASPEGPIFTNPAAMSSVILRLPLTVSTADECSGASIPGVTFSRSSSATCTKSDGTVVTLAADKPRVTAAGLLVEGGATNLLLQSESLDNAAWAKSGTPTVTANAAVAPDGNTTADQITIDGPANATASVQQSLSGGTAGASYTPSVYIKRVSTSGSISIANPGASANGQWDVDLSLLGTGWNRITATHPAVTVVAAFTYTSGGVGGVVFRTKVSGALTVNVWGVQVENGSVATSYIPTTGTSAARTADIATVPTTNWPTSIASFALTWTPSQASYGSLGYLIDAGGASTGASLLVGTTTTRFQVGGTTISGAPPGSAWTPGTSYRLRATVEGTSGALYIDGTSNVTGTVGSLTAYTATANIGSRTSDSAALGFGWFKNLCVGKTPGACQ